MSHVTVEAASQRLLDLIRQAPAGEEIILTENGAPIAKLTPLPRSARKAGSGQDIIHFIADDFKSIPPEFEEYLP